MSCLPKRACLPDSGGCADDVCSVLLELIPAHQFASGWDAGERDLVMDALCWSTASGYLCESLKG